MAALDHFDVAIFGAGVMGLAIAENLSNAPFMARRNIVLLEQEDTFGQHTSSRNSEVIHAGIYYPVGSLKAAHCVRGRQLLYEYCQRHEIPHRRLGKLIVAGQDAIPQLENLLSQGNKNGVEDLRLIGHEEIRKLESEVTSCTALLSPSSGIVDSHAFMFSLLQQAEARGVIFSPRSRIETVDTHPGGFVVDTCIRTTAPSGDSERYRFHATSVVNCAGLEAAALAERIAGVPPSSIPRLFYCKGDYFAFVGKHHFRHLIYPVPEPDTVGLGIHATLDLGGRLRFGPDSEYIEQLRYDVDPSKAASFAESISRFFPAIRVEQLAPDYAGIRPKLSGPGEPAADFMIQTHREHGLPGLIQLFGIESPGLTASLAMAEHVSSLLRESF